MRSGGATGYDKRDYIFDGTLATAAVVIWLCDLVKEASISRNGQ